MRLIKLKSIITISILDKIKSSFSLAVFASKRSRFEGWLKVEIINSLILNGKNASPEVDRVDIVFDNVGIELKTINTNNKSNGKPITCNIKSIINDIDKLNKSNFKYKFIVFIVYPINHNNNFWQKHLNKIVKKTKECLHTEFYFKNGTPGVIYFLNV